MNPKEKLTGADYRYIAICLALLAGTAWYAASNFYRAFPEASIDFRVNRTEARDIAARFLREQGMNFAGFRNASSFTYDDQAKTFLEREAGLERAQQILGSQVRLWRWSYRWFRPQQKEEFRAAVTPGGEVVGFTHDLAEDTARPDIDLAQARALAESFLRSRMHRDPDALDFVESSSDIRPHRTDRAFTWKVREFNLHDATYRIQVSLAGNEISGYHEFLKIPEQWTRDYQKLRSRNDAAQTADLAAMAVLILGLVAVLVTRVRLQDVRWRRAAWVGIIGMVLSFCATANSFPLQEFSYPTTDSYSSFLTRQFLNALLTALASGGFLFVLTAGAEPLYREALGDKISLGNLFRLRGLRTKRFFLGAILGVTLTSIFIAYQTVFYIVAYKFGAWSPADVPYDDLLNTKFPWAFVLFGGFFPAISEEFLFRMFAIPFLRKVTRSIPIALILAGYIWGFGHAGYAQQPFWIRGVEVGTGGVALGIIMLRWGILPTLIWHYSVDAMYSAMLLLRSHSLYFRLSGAMSAGIVVLPIALALIAYLRYGGFESETGLLNADEPGPIEPLPGETAPAAPTIAYFPLARRMRGAAVIIFILGLLTLRLPVAHFGESPRYNLTAGQARAASDAFLGARGINPRTFQRVTYPAVHWGDSDSLAGRYFLERLPVSAASRLFENYRPIQHWATRYFKSLDAEEATVTVQPETAKVMGFDHSLPEDRPGADISADAARQIAADFAASRGQPVTGMDLKQSLTEKRKARRDYTLVWEASPGDPRNVDQARYRIEVRIAGDQPTAFRSYWFLPEAFERSRTSNNLLSIAIRVAGLAALTGIAVWSLWLLIHNIRRGLVPWRPAMIAGGIATVLLLLSRILSWEQMLTFYQTEIPFETFVAMQYIIVVVSGIFGFIVTTGAAALLMSCFPQAAAAFRRANRRVMGLDAAAAALAAAGLALIFSRVTGFLLDRFHAEAFFSFSAPDILVSGSPAVSALASTLEGGLLYLAAVAAALLALRRLGRWAWPVVLIALVAFVPSEVRTPAEFAVNYAFALLAGGFAALLCWRFLRNNYLGYALIILLAGIRGPVASLLQTGIPRMHFHAWIVIAITAALAAWIVFGGADDRGLSSAKTPEKAL
jgi:membrane protease YdiL (CAAX protease family)